MSDPVPSRRNFIQTSAAAGAMVLAFGAAAGAQEQPKPSGNGIGCAVIGCGTQGKEILRALAALPLASVKAIGDNYSRSFRLAKRIVPDATTYEDTAKLLADEAVEAVFIATPTHLHKQLVIDAIAAGKHVYCEAPLSNTIEEAAEIARAGRASQKVFQVGLQQRGSPAANHAVKFFQAGVLDKIVQGRLHWHRKESWFRAAGSPEREQELNWRLHRETSAGLPGEVGLHLIDLATWALGRRPRSVQAIGGILQWTEDDRDVADTVLATFEYPGKISVSLELSLANSFEGSYALFMGNQGSILMRDERGWLIKEADAPTLGWEVYARQDKLGEDLGIVLVAGATKLMAAGQMPSEHAHDADARDSLSFALEGFLTSVKEGEPPACDALTGYQATMLGIRTAEALRTGQRVEFKDEWFDLA